MYIRGGQVKSGWHNFYPVLNCPGGPWRRGVSEKSSRRGSSRGTPPPYRCSGSGTLRDPVGPAPTHHRDPPFGPSGVLFALLDPDAESDPHVPMALASAAAVPYSCSGRSFSQGSFPNFPRGVSDPGRVRSRPLPSPPPPPLSRPRSSLPSLLSPSPVPPLPFRSQVLPGLPSPSPSLSGPPSPHIPPPLPSDSRLRTDTSDS